MLQRYQSLPADLKFRDKALRAFCCAILKRPSSGYPLTVRSSNLWMPKRNLSIFVSLCQFKVNLQICAETQTGHIHMNIFHASCCQIRLSLYLIGIGLPASTNWCFFLQAWGQACRDACPGKGLKQSLANREPYERGREASFLGVGEWLQGGDYGRDEEVGKSAIPVFSWHATAFQAAFCSSLAWGLNPSEIRHPQISQDFANCWHTHS